jgi:hypothetical protein
MLNIVPQLYRVKSYRTYRYRGSALLVQVVNTSIDKETEPGVSVLETCQNRKKKEGYKVLCNVPGTVTGLRRSRRGLAVWVSRIAPLSWAHGTWWTWVDNACDIGCTPIAPTRC